MVDGDVRGGPLHLGIDIGTSWTKVVLLDHDGDAVAKAARPFTVSHLGNGWVEQDPEMVLHNVVAAVHQVCDQAPTAGLASIAVTGQGDGCWLTDAAGLPTRAGISWMDARAAPLVRSWAADGTIQRCFRANGNTLFPGSQAALLRWLAEHEPESLDRSETAGYCKDMVFQRLTGLRATDPTDASLPFGSVSGHAYDEGLVAACGLTPWARLLAPVVSPHPAAPLSHSAARLLRLPAGTPVTSGPFDMAACAVGAGVTDVDDGLLIVGTSLGCQVVVDGPPGRGKPAGMTIPAGAGRWLRIQATMLGCASLDWLLATVGMAHEDIDAALGSTAPGAGGVEALPYLSPSGERAPFVETAATGQFTGIRLTTTRHELVRGLCESLAFAARECFEATGRLTGAPLAVCGGGSRSLPWLEIFASVLGGPLTIARPPEVGARGAVLSALVSSGADIDADAWTAPSGTVEPDDKLVGFYDDAYRRYLAHRQSAAGHWRS